jgi:uncharacterized repeat protein (TIGR04052 family)
MRIALIPAGLIMAVAAICTGQAAPAKQQPFSIGFALTLDGKEVGCGAPLTKLGTGLVEAKLREARIYVYGLALIDAKGKRVPVTLTRNDWQFADLALLDFKDARGGNAPCSEATPAKNVTVSGAAPQGSYVGLEFSVGVPVRAEVDGATVSLNHSSTETAAPPLDIAAMGWSWQAGRKFMLIEVDPAGGITKPDGAKARSFAVHLGSTGCTGNPATGEIVACARKNRFTVTLDRFDPHVQKVDLDLAVLFKNTDLSVDKGGAIGCMSGADDPECGAIFEQIGLNLVDTSQAAGDAGNQRREGVSPVFSASAPIVIKAAGAKP